LKWELWNRGTQLRGAVIHYCRYAENDICLEFLTKQDLDDLRSHGANLIHASIPGIYTQNPPFEVNPEALNYLDNLVSWANATGLYIVIGFRTGPGRNEAAIHNDSTANYEVWKDQDTQQAWIEMWQYTARRYADNPAVIGYNLMIEPHVNRLADPNRELSIEEVHALMMGTLMDWNAFAREITLGIRSVDPKTPIIVSSLDWGDPSWFTVLEPTGDPFTIYTVHLYNPLQYTHQLRKEIEYSYPSSLDYYGYEIYLDSTWLMQELHPATQFAKENQVPIFVGEFGVMRWVPNGAGYLRDITNNFELLGWNYTYYVWRFDEDNWDGFNLEHGPDPNIEINVQDNPIIKVFIEKWKTNLTFLNPTISPLK
jgi:aryl-phospho-beta-D-glucosidase BglC (GH1 family)